LLLYLKNIKRNYKSVFYVYFIDVKVYHSVKTNHLRDQMSTEQKYAYIVPFGLQGQCDLGFCAADEKGGEPLACLVKGKYVRMSGNFQAPVLIMMCKLCEIWGSYRGMVLVSLPNM